MSNDMNIQRHRSARQWLQAVLLQLGRLKEDQERGEEIALVSKHSHSYGWDDALPFYNLDVDKHFLLVASRQLAFALGHFSEPPAPRHDRDLLSALRNALEHDGEGALRRGTQAPLDEAGVTNPRSYSWSGTDAVIGGVLQVGDLEAWASEVERYLKAVELAS